MTSGRAIPLDLRKESRALLPLWLGCMAVVWVGGLADRSGFLFRAAFLSYLLGSAALGALSIGHEYTNRTLPVLLSLPVSRRRMFAMKAGVLLAMLVSLAALALFRLPVSPAGREMQDTAVVGVVSLLGSAFLAPWLTIVCRNPIAGAVFGLSIPAAVLVGSELATAAVYGVAQLNTHVAERFRMEFLWGGMLLLSAIGACLSWRAFTALETIEGPHEQLAWPRLFSRSRETGHEARPAHPIWQLVRKEFHLQQLTFVVSGLFACAVAVRLLLPREFVNGIDQPLVILTVVHGVIVALLSGSLASAEERHLGTLESQVLMPMALVRQWVVKVTVVFGVCLLLSIALPTVLALTAPAAGPMRVDVTFAAAVISLAAVSLYVSSVSSSGLQALLFSGPTAVSIVVLFEAIGSAVLWVSRVSGITRRHEDLVVALGGWTIAMLDVIVVVMLLRFALTNHRLSDRTPSRLWRQLLLLSGSVASMMLIGLAIARG